MNKISIIVESILGAAVIALFVLFFTVNPWAKKPADGEVEAQGELLPIAVVNTDSILAHYTLAVEANDKLQSKYEESMVKMDGKAKAFQKEYETFQKDVMDFQRKVEANAFLSRERAESEQRKLQKKSAFDKKSNLRLFPEIVFWTIFLCFYLHICKKSSIFAG